MRRRQNTIRAVKLLSLVLALAVSVWFLQSFVLRYADNNLERMKGFYLEDPDSIDVILIGASEVYSDFASCYAYEKFGYTSYPVATTGNIAQNYRTQLKTSIERQHPKMIVIEVNGMLYRDDEDYAEEGRFRKYVDNLPPGEDRDALIAEYASDRLWEYRFPILKYHSVWKDPHGGILWTLSAMEDERRGYSCLKGVKTRSEIYTTTKKLYNDSVLEDGGREELNGTALRCLRGLLDYCREENLENVVFVRFPHLLVKKRLPQLHRSNAVGDLVAEYGYDYINFDGRLAEAGLDAEKDFYDLDHLNIYGQKKFTEYLGRMLQETYGVGAGSLLPAQRERWDSCIKYYEAFCRYADELILRGKSRDIGESFLDMIAIRRYVRQQDEETGI